MFTADELQYENDRLKDLVDGYERAQAQRLEAQRIERKERQEMNAITAHCWAEAFEKQRARFKNEIFYIDAEPDNTDSFFHKMEEINDRGEKLYLDAECSLNEQIKTLTDQMHRRIVKQLREEFGNDVDMLAEALLNDDPSSYLYW